MCTEQGVMVTDVPQAIIHPDTGQKIFMPFRMSGTVSGESCTATVLTLLQVLLHLGL